MTRRRRGHLTAAAAVSAVTAGILAATIGIPAATQGFADAAGLRHETVVVKTQSDLAWKLKQNSPAALTREQEAGHLIPDAPDTGSVIEQVRAAVQARGAKWLAATTTHGPSSKIGTLLVRSVNVTTTLHATATQIGDIVAALADPARLTAVTRVDIPTDGPATLTLRVYFGSGNQ